MRRLGRTGHGSGRFFPELTFRSVPFVLTIEGQYIVKNLVLVTAGLVIGATVRGGGLVAGPASASKAE